MNSDSTTAQAACELDAVLAPLKSLRLVDEVLYRLVEACEGMTEAKAIADAAKLLLEDRQLRRRLH